MLDESNPIGYADNVEALVTARKVEHAQMDGLNSTKSFSSLSRGFPIFLPIQFGETIVFLKLAVKYLGVMINTKVIFFIQICNKANNTAAIMFAIYRLVYNAGGPLSSRHHLVTTAV